MSEQTKFKTTITDYLLSIAEDSNDPARVQALINTWKLESIAVHDTPEAVELVRLWIQMLFKEMPELSQKDPSYTKLLPLFYYCDAINQARPTSKPPKTNP